MDYLGNRKVREVLRIIMRRTGDRWDNRKYNSLGM